VIKRADAHYAAPDHHCPCRRFHGVRLLELVALPAIGALCQPSGTADNSQPRLLRHYRSF
jgi:hypothetical protein